MSVIVVSDIVELRVIVLGVLKVVIVVTVGVVLITE
jgi:hypothetical protein